MNDLGFNKSLDTHIGDDRPKDIKKFQDKVFEAFKSYPSEKLTKLVGTKQLIIKGDTILA